MLISLSWRTNEYKSIPTTMKRIQSKLEVQRLWHVRHKLISIYYIFLVETLGGTPECRGAHRPLSSFQDLSLIASTLSASMLKIFGEES
jgi:hypothetical protein